MTTYLISTSKKHYTVAHLLAPDGQHALCTAKPGEKTWPYVGGKVTGGEWVISEDAGDRLVCSAGGEWVISEDAGDRLVCSACKNKANPKRPPRVATRAERKRAEELERLRQWNEVAKL